MKCKRVCVREARTHENVHDLASLAPPPCPTAEGEHRQRGTYERPPWRRRANSPEFRRDRVMQLVRPSAVVAIVRVFELKRRSKTGRETARTHPPQPEKRPICHNSLCCRNLSMTAEQSLARNLFQKHDLSMTAE